MSYFISFIKLTRWPNLVFILLAQFLFWYFVLPFAYVGGSGVAEPMKLSGPLFFCLTIASVLIAAAGYIINDYFDVDIDQVNKASRVIVGNQIKRRMAIFLHALLSFTGLVLSMYVAYELQNFYIAFFNFLTILILWFYSTTFKKKLLIGNIMIAVLTAWVIVVLALAEYRFRLSTTDVAWQRIVKFSLIYAGLTGIISLVREVIKDMEDLEGDKRFGCRTMPILWGIPATKVFTGVWLVVLIGLVLSIIIYLLQFGYWLVAVYSLITLVLPLVWVLRKLYYYRQPAQYHQLSTVIKFIMLAGILSMLFFYKP